MKKIFIFIICIELFSYSFNAVAIEVTDKISDCNGSILKMLQSNILEERYEGLVQLNKDLNKCNTNEDLKKQIIMLGKKEIELKETINEGELGEEYSSELIIALGNTKDPAAIPYLIDDLGSGTLVVENLLKIGEPAVGPLIDIFNNKYIGIRDSAAQALSIFVDPGVDGNLLKSKSLILIKTEFMKQLKDDRNQYPKDVDVDEYKFRAREVASLRRNLVKGLGYIATVDNGEVLQLIEFVEKNDNYHEKIKNKNGQTRDAYPVKEEAAKILEALRPSRLPR